MDNTVEKIEELAKEMYEDISNIVQSVDMIPNPYSTWLQRVTLEDFLTFMRVKYGRFEKETEIWHSLKGNVEAPKGTFDKIYEDDDL